MAIITVARFAREMWFEGEKIREILNVRVWLSRDAKWGSLANVVRRISPFLSCLSCVIGPKRDGSWRPTSHSLTFDIYSMVKFGRINAWYLQSQSIDEIDRVVYFLGKLPLLPLRAEPAEGSAMNYSAQINVQRHNLLTWHVPLLLKLLINFPYNYERSLREQTGFSYNQRTKGRLFQLIRKLNDT